MSSSSSVFKILLTTFTVAIAKKHANDTQTSLTPLPPSTTATKYNLCLDLDQITLSGPAWPERMNTAKSGTKGIFYVYDAQNSLDTFKSFTFPLEESWPVTISFDDDEDNEA